MSWDAITISDERRTLLDNAFDQLWRARSRIEDSDTPGPEARTIRDDEQRALQPLLDDGFEVAGVGFGRVVLYMPAPHEEYVVKIGRYGDNLHTIGQWQNDNELALWDFYKNDDRLLLPIVARSDPYPKWLAMPEGQPLEDTQKHTDEIDQLVQTVQDNLSDTRIKRGDIGPDNIVAVDGTPYVSDYGHVRSIYL